MALFDRIKFDAPSDQWFVSKFPGDEIHFGSRLIVNQSQQALLFKGGEVVEVFGPGAHSLTTKNVPVLSRFVNEVFGGKTPFPAEVWFVNLHSKLDLLWGTQSPIPLIDPQFNFPVSVRAYGRWGVRIDDAVAFMTQLVATLNSVSDAAIDAYFSSEVVQQLSDCLSRRLVDEGESVFRTNARLTEIADKTKEAIALRVKRFGLAVESFTIERVSIPSEELEKFQAVLGKRMEIDQISKAEVSEAYRLMRTFDALDKAAASSGDEALSAGFGLAAGTELGRSTARAIGNALGSGAGEGQAAHESRLRQLEKLRDCGLISDEEFKSQRNRIINEI